MRQYILGFDFGTLSCRVLAVDAATGESLFERSMDYPSGAMTSMPDGGELPPGWCIQDPDDYILTLCSLSHAASDALADCQCVAIGTDFTNCTVVPLNSHGAPLCTLPRFRAMPHAWPKLWKHHAAQPQAERIEGILAEEDPEWFAYYGGGVSSEWLYPKLLQVYEEAPELFCECDLFMEAADYITLYLTGHVTRNSATLGVNAFYSPESGGPEVSTLERFAPGFGSAVLPKLRGDILTVGSAAGTLRAEAAKKMGLSASVIVSVGHGDSEVACAGLGITAPGSMLMVMGTSTCYQLLSREKRGFPGVCAVVEDAMIPGLTAYESGQPAVGDALDWYIRAAMPREYKNAAEDAGMSQIQYMDMRASQLAPGEAGLVSLDWMNGNRSVLKDYDLRAFFAGLTLNTKPEGIFRSMIEATAFGARKILESHESAGVRIDRVEAAGGLARKSALTMQIYANVLSKPIHVTDVTNASAMGACVCGAVALRYGIGTREAFEKASDALISHAERVYLPEEKATAIYNELYSLYCELYDFAQKNAAMSRRLSSIQRAAKAAFEK